MALGRGLLDFGTFLERNTRDKEYHVLNGHLWGLQALYMLAEASGDKELKDAYQCARHGTISRLPQFYNKTDTWTWYPLVPRVINPTHYNIIEINFAFS